jgi:hypothetical protein
MRPQTRAKESLAASRPTAFKHEVVERALLSEFDRGFDPVARITRACADSDRFHGLRPRRSDREEP